MQRGHSLSSLQKTPSTMSGFGVTPAFSFGQSSSAAAPVNFGFGAPASSSFGTAASTGFGAPASTGFGAPVSTGFGTTATPAATFGSPAATTGFGAPTASGFGAPSVSGFGAPASQAFGAPSATGFGFGAPAATTGFGAPATTGFGAPSATGFGFGAPAATTGFGAPAATGFGAPTTTGFGASSAPAFGGFSAPAASTGFGSPAFGGFGAATTPASGFGSSISGFGSFGGASFGVPASSFGAPAAPIATAQYGLYQYPGGDKVLDIQHSYAPILDSQTGLPAPAATADRPHVSNDAMCKFDTIKYNPKPVGGSSGHQLNIGSRWEQAERDNPDPDALEAVRELGIAALRKRFETQNSECEKYRAHAADLRGIVEAVDKSTRQTGLRVEALQMKQKQLYNKMLSVVRSVEVLRCQGVPIDSSERRYRERLERLLAGLRAPQSELLELMSMGAQQDRPADVYSDFMSAEDVDAMCRVLKKQRDGLQHLTDILTKDSRDVAIVRQRLKPVVQQTF